MLGFPDGQGYDRDKVEEWIAKVDANPSRQHFVVIAPEAGFCGETCFEVGGDNKRASLEIKLIPQAQGQGLARDALSTLIQHVFEVEEDVNSVWMRPSQANQATRRLYQRCGLRPAAHHADIQDGESYSALSRERYDVK
jgi:RimJ/RimL family protein N-acetyltransferase